ncbi:hypothetical protein CN938_22150 [Bacillus thuringiensis]|nr:hypothetical protein CN938_22150 [Bacillus thuringiensis]
MKMKEIKFRAWDGDRMQKVLTLGLYEGFVDTNKLHSDIEDFKLMQYTGLKDKNGKEIYEGDIVKVSDHPFNSSIKVDGHYEVGYDSETMDLCCGGWYLHRMRHWAEVVGNIYETPELLGASK